MHGRGPQPGRGEGRRKKRLSARARWEVEIGPGFIAAMRKAGREIDPADLPPWLEWEGDIWRLLYERIRTQWRVGMRGATGLDYNPAIAIINTYGWRLDLALELLQAVEFGFLEAWKEQRGNGSQN